MNEDLEYIRKRLFDKQVMTKDHLLDSTYKISGGRFWNLPRSANPSSIVTIQGTNNVDLDKGGMHPIVIDEIVGDSFEKVWEEEIFGIRCESLPVEIDDTHLKPWQATMVKKFLETENHIIIKGRQIGMSWLMVYFMMGFRPGWFCTDSEHAKRTYETFAEEIHKLTGWSRENITVLSSQYAISELQYWNAKDKSRQPMTLYFDEFGSWDSNDQDGILRLWSPHWGRGTNLIISTPPNTNEDLAVSRLIRAVEGGARGDIHIHQIGNRNVWP